MENRAKDIGVWCMLYECMSVCVRGYVYVCMCVLYVLCCVCVVCVDCLVSGECEKP